MSRTDPQNLSERLPRALTERSLQPDGDEPLKGVRCLLHVGRKQEDLITDCKIDEVDRLLEPLESFFFLFLFVGKHVLGELIPGKVS